MRWRWIVGGVVLALAALISIPFVLTYVRMQAEEKQIFQVRSGIAATRIPSLDDYAHYMRTSGAPKESLAAFDVDILPLHMAIENFCAAFPVSKARFQLLAAGFDPKTEHMRSLLGFIKMWSLNDADAAKAKAGK